MCAKGKGLLTAIQVLDVVGLRVPLRQQVLATGMEFVRRTGCCRVLGCDTQRLLLKRGFVGVALRARTSVHLKGPLGCADSPSESTTSTVGRNDKVELSEKREC